eukprot:988530-Prorocentrum_minimum.AAC.2
MKTICFHSSNHPAFYKGRMYYNGHLRPKQHTHPRPTSAYTPAHPHAAVQAPTRRYRYRRSRVTPSRAILPPTPFILLALRLGVALAAGAAMVHGATDSTRVGGTQPEVDEEWAQKSVDGTPFGHKLKSRFGLAPEYANLNHGSFGALSNEVRDAQRKLLEQAESRPDKWFRNDYFVKVEQVRSLAPVVESPITSIEQHCSKRIFLRAAPGSTDTCPALLTHLPHTPYYRPLPE